MGRLWRPEWFYKLPRDHEDSEYVLTLEIGQRESGFYSERTDSTYRQYAQLFFFQYKS